METQANQTCQILVADDDDTWLGFYVELLEYKYGLDCIQAKSPEEVIAILVQGGVEHFLCDGTGWKTAIEKAISLGIHTVIQTGDPDSFRGFGVTAVTKIFGPTAVLEAFLTEAKLLRK